MTYDKLLIATGTQIRKSEIPGSDAKHVYYLRTGHDQEQIKEWAKNGVKRGVAIIGGGFISTEVASSLILHYKDKFDVHVISTQETPMEKVFGKQVGEALANKHRTHGVKLHMKNEVTEILKREEDGTVYAVILKDGTRLPVDMVIMANGVTPATKFLERTETGVKVDKDGAIICDPFMQTTNSDIFAAGDVASYPYWLSGEQIRIEHWINAGDQGQHAAYNMLGKFIPYGTTPLFWGRQYNKTLMMIGHCSSFDEVFIQGDIPAQAFLGYHIKDDKICAVSHQGKYKDILTLYEAFNQNKMPSAADIKSGKETPSSIKKKLVGAGHGGCINCRCKKLDNLKK